METTRLLTGVAAALGFAGFCAAAQPPMEYDISPALRRIGCPVAEAAAQQFNVVADCTKAADGATRRPASPFDAAMAQYEAIHGPNCNCPRHRKPAIPATLFGDGK